MDFQPLSRRSKETIHKLVESKVIKGMLLNLIQRNLWYLTIPLGLKNLLNHLQLNLKSPKLISQLTSLKNSTIDQECKK